MVFVVTKYTFSDSTFYRIICVKKREKKINLGVFTNA